MAKIELEDLKKKIANFRLTSSYGIFKLLNSFFRLIVGPFSQLFRLSCSKISLIKNPQKIIDTKYLV